MLIEPKFVTYLLEQLRIHIHGIHGIFHWARVMENGMLLAESTGARMDVVEYFALLHDSQRYSEGGDHQHGPRGADFAERIRDPWIKLDDEGFRMLVHAIRHHTAGGCDSDVTVQVCWDSDRLELARAGINPDPRLLCTPKAREAETIRWANQRARGGWVATGVLDRWGVDWQRYAR